MKKLFLLLLAPALVLPARSFVVPGPTQTEAALQFINALNPAQKGQVLLPFSEKDRYRWSYLPTASVPRRGLALKDLNAAQRGLLNDLLQAYLGAEGYAKTQAIIVLEDILRQLSPGSTYRDPEQYVVAVYGQPDKEGLWGWKFEGHHLSLNFTVVKDRVAFAPFFFGANPAEVADGPHKGLRALATEEDLGFGLVNSLDAAQRRKALIRATAFADILTSDDSQAAPLPPAGIAAGELTPAQLALLHRLIGAYLSAMPPALAAGRKSRLETEDGKAIRFGWAGATVRGKPHYYRVQGKTFLIEFDNTQNGANHIHTVWRDFAGDFGRDILREHYKHAAHHQKAR